MAAVREKAYPMGNPGILGTPPNSMEPHHTKESLDKKTRISNIKANYQVIQAKRPTSFWVGHVYNL